MNNKTLKLFYDWLRTFIAMRIFRSRSVITKIQISFILLILLSILFIGFFSYTFSSRMLIENEKKNSVSMLRQAKDIIDRHVVESNGIAIQIAANSYVRRACHEGNYDIVNAYEIKRYLASIKNTCEWIDHMAVYIENSDTIITDEASYHLEMFFNQILTLEDMQTERWRQILREPAGFRLLGVYKENSRWDNRNIILFTMSMPIGEVTVRGTVLIWLDEEVFKSYITDTEENQQNLSFVTDPQGNIITRNGNPSFISDNTAAEQLAKQNAEKSTEAIFSEQKLENRNFTMIDLTSAISGWHFTTFVPNRQITAKARTIGSVTLVIALFCLIIGLVLSLLIAKRIYHPIQKMVHYLEMLQDKKEGTETVRSKDEISFISHIVDVIYNEKETLQSLMDESVPMLREKYLGDLLNGKMQEDKVLDLAEKLGLKFPYQSFMAVAIDFGTVPYEGRGMKGANGGMGHGQFVDARLIPAELTDWAVLRYEKTQNMQILIINLQEENETIHFIMDNLRKIISHYLSEAGTHATAGIGGIRQGLGSVAESYIEALFSLKYKAVRGEGSIIHIDEVKEVLPSYIQYPLETEKVMINYIKLGDTAKISELLEGIFKLNDEQAVRSPEIMESLIAALTATLVRVVYEVEISMDDIFGEGFDIKKNLRQINGLEGKHTYTKEVFVKAAEYIRSKKKSQKEQVYTRIMEEIEINYPGELSLSQVADKIGVSNSYASWIFKEVSGRNFADVLSSIRVENAKKLLRTGSLNLLEIGQRVGFNNVHTFIRVFKKLEGVTPGQYRDQTDGKTTVN